MVEDTYRLNFVTPACLGTMVAIADWGSAGDPHDVVHDAGAVSLPARPRRGARDRRGSHPGAAAAGRRQLRPWPRHLPDRRHRRHARARGAAAREDRVRPGRGIHGLSHARAVRDPARHRGRSRRAAPRPRRARDDRRRRLYVVGVDDALRDDVDRRRAVPRAERPVRHDDRLHEQPLLGLDARLRQSRVDVRGRVADGRSRRSPRHRPARAQAAQRHEVGRRQPAGIRAHVVRDARVPRRRRAKRSRRIRRRRRRAASGAWATPACSTSAAARASTARTGAARS